VIQRRLLPLIAVTALLCATAAQAEPHNSNIKHVLLISVDGMHAIDFLNCAHGLTGVNNGEPYCPTFAALGRTGIHYVAASASKPSDSFPGLMTIVSGATPRSLGVYYDVAYDRSIGALRSRRATAMLQARANHMRPQPATQLSMKKASTSTKHNLMGARPTPA